jgi:hypothetical protein
VRSSKNACFVTIRIGVIDLDGFASVREVEIHGANLKFLDDAHDCRNFRDRRAVDLVTLIKSILGK